jgi:hypothetical protein
MHGCAAQAQLVECISSSTAYCIPVGNWINPNHRIFITDMAVTLRGGVRVEQAPFAHGVLVCR